MPHQSKATHIHFNIINLPCSEHGPHRVIIAGLDVLADDVADIALRELRALGEQATMLSRHIPMDEAQRMAFGEGMEHDDLPY